MDRYMEPNRKLLANIKADLPALEDLLKSVEDDYGAPEHIYRFYYQSFKAYWAQSTTLIIVEALKNLSVDDMGLDERYLRIVEEGTNKTFKMEDNSNWMEVVRPQIEALFHSWFFLREVVKWGKELEEAPTMLPYGWAAVLCLFNMR